MNQHFGRSDAQAGQWLVLFRNHGLDAAINQQVLNQMGFRYIGGPGKQKPDRVDRGS